MTELPGMRFASGLLRGKVALVTGAWRKADDRYRQLCPARTRRRQVEI